MISKVRILAFMIAAALLFCTAAFSQTQKTAATATQKTNMIKMVAKGTFEVKMTPLAPEENIGDAMIGRLGMAKEFNGDLTGASKGQMLGSQSEAVKGSGGYVALESFKGSLNGKTGGFLLQHNGTMQGGKFDLNVIVVPDSGTGELAGIAGTFKIIIDGDKHKYEFEYTIPAAK